MVTSDSEERGKEGKTWGKAQKPCLKWLPDEMACLWLLRKAAPTQPEKSSLYEETVTSMSLIVKYIDSVRMSCDRGEAIREGKCLSGKKSVFNAQEAEILREEERQKASVYDVAGRLSVLF